MSDGMAGEFNNNAIDKSIWFDKTTELVEAPHPLVGLWLYGEETKSAFEIASLIPGMAAFMVRRDIDGAFLIVTSRALNGIPLYQTKEEAIKKL